MNFYVVSGKSAKALAVYDVDEFDIASRQAAKEFGSEVIVLDEELYRLEQRISSQRARLMAKRLMGKRHRHIKKGA
jgi:hypothetical protein